MQRKSVILVADSLDVAHRLQRVLAGMDAAVVAGPTAQLEQLLAQHPTCDLVICEAHDGAPGVLGRAERLLLADGASALLVVVDAAALGGLRLPAQVKNDFVVHGATDAECAARIRQLLWPGSAVATGECLVVDALTINLATYQVKVAGEPVDLTYLEYALLAFLATHPGRTYSRDALLRRVWGFDYYGGSRTVDVHVRRVRAKLGPDLAQHLETVRGVGYLWSA